MAKQKTITEQDIAENPILAQLEGTVGDKVSVALSDEKQAEKDAADAQA